MTDGTARYRAVLEDVWPDVRREFNYPVIRDVRFAAEGDEDAYRWRDDELVLSKRFLDRLDVADGELRSVIEPLLKHELGHYVLFPRELVHHLRYLQRATEVFGDDYGSRYYSLYADVCVDLRLLGDGYAGEGLLDLYERILEVATVTASEIEATVQRRLHRLLIGLYQERFPAIPERVTLTETERSWLAPLLDIDYLAEEPAAHERNVIRFGNALEAILADVPERAALELDSPMDDGKSASSRPFGGSDPAAVPDAELDDALSDAASQGGIRRYERLLEFLESQADFEEHTTSGESGAAAGIEPGSFERHDELIPFYRRWARNVRIRVTETDVPRDSAELYRHGRRPFELDDPIRDINPFASFGVVGVPGVTKVDAYAEGEDQTHRRTVPDLLVGLDSSASMPEPTEESHAVLAAFVLAATYRRNGARIAGYNFSTGVGFHPPTTDLAPVHSLACGYWGGGTVFDHDALAEFLRNEEELDGFTFSTADARDQLLESVAENEGEREPTGLFDGGQRTVDHVLVTDGNVLNRESLIDHVDRAADDIRTFVFVTDQDALDDWTATDVDAWIYGATDEQDLIDRVLGLAAHRTSID